MAVDTAAYQKIKKSLDEKNVTLVAVSKTKPVEDIKALYALGQRAFGENYVQELSEKEAVLPKDIHWHFIGHLQSNKVKMIAPFVHLIHAIDSIKLLKEVNKQAQKYGRKIDCLLQVHIADEETKFGFDETELDAVDINSFTNVNIKGLMGMASFTGDMQKVGDEFDRLKIIFNEFKAKYPNFEILSMGMSADYETAIAKGSTMVRIGSLLFGKR
jgi:pyridoxal phosphate enzyme (YggS family)